MQEEARIHSEIARIGINFFFSRLFSIVRHGHRHSAGIALEDQLEILSLRSEHEHQPRAAAQIRLRHVEAPPRRFPYDMEPGYYELGHLWLYGNARLLQKPLAYVSLAQGKGSRTAKELEQIEVEAEQIIFDHKVLVCGIQNEAHQRACVVPLRWGAPRIIVFSGGFRYHLGPDLSNEPFRAARLWRYQWDARTDLAISRRAPDKLPTYSSHNPTVDTMIRLIAQGQWPGLRSDGNPLENLLAAPRQ